MNPSLAFWTAALIDLLAIVTLIAIGIRSIRRGHLAQHRRCMKTAAALVVCFLGIYPLKVLFFGRERLSEWSEQAIAVLRFHEICVFAMIVGGVLALIQARKMHGDRSRLAQLPGTPLASNRVLRRHRRAGWAAATGAGLAFVTAAIVLAGMYERAGGH